MVKRDYEYKNRLALKAHEHRNLKLADQSDKPLQFEKLSLEEKPKVLTVERKLPSLAKTSPPYQKWSNESIEEYNKFETFYDPMFNADLLSDRDKVNPEEEPFNAIYADSKSDAAHEYTKVRNITTPELWQYVERLARYKISPQIPKRKLGEPVKTLPSGFVPPCESPPDLPYFVPRTRTHLLPVYYKLHSDPGKSYTLVKHVSGDLWKLEEDLRTYLQSLHPDGDRILTSVQETDDQVQFRGRHLHQVVDWLHSKGF